MLTPSSPSLVLDNGAQALGVVHHVHGGVDGLDALQLVSDEVVDGQLARQVLVHQLGHLCCNDERKE